MMKTKKNTIKVLSSSVIEKIAAGEVIERPASVLKELVENSIDASSTKIEITVEGAGFSLIRVSDNGLGMSSTDLEKCVVRHATSKINSADDLFMISTMGFRGEAMASVAAVSRLNVVSSDNDSGLGYAISSEGGVVKGIEPQQHLRGTKVTVRDLFYNVPARKKFMKTQRAEQLAIVRMLEQMVIPFPGIHFTVTVDGKKVMEIPECGSPRERIAAVGGTKFAQNLIECSEENDGVSALLYVSTPETLQKRPRFQSLYVNLRRIDNDSVTFAVREAFSRFLGHGNRPSFFCFLDIDPGCIDVNVHPTKQQIKFDEDRRIFGFIYRAVKSGIEKMLISKDDFRESAKTDIENLSDTYPALHSNAGEEGGGKDTGAQREKPKEEESAFQTILPFPASKRYSEKELDHKAESSVQLDNDDKDVLWNLIPCYQIHGMFILAPIKNGILLIDQHAAHERVLFEQALKDLHSGRTASQQLLFPVLFEVSPTEKAIIESGKEYFSGFGFEIADFGGNTISVSAIPAFLKDGQVENTIREMIRYLLDGRGSDAFGEPTKRFAAAFACGAAIKSGQKLSQEEMNALLNSLFSAKNPYTCPHGRPTLVRMSLDELTRRFLR
ncbi:DNA mismatch repair endonuclease MutL [Chitinispirillales bacterium ANBcel5]|uniref:DNA mismatch repair endonuclease MutL n=1 Tax=Cellulosispirillum alkaliphilum TaxID=3039283 RepID=UPI002A4F338F|nr:DNA mismatch repair endonuclease MutL [Chitinispirillales bacterium ANBcel5]